MAESVVRGAAANVERGLSIPLESSERLASSLAENPSQDRTAIGAAAAGILASAPWITGVSVAPDAVVRYHFPEQGNESLIGHDLMTNPERRDALLDAVQRRTSVLAGPVEEIDDNVSVDANAFVRTPVFVSSGKFWGFVSVSIDFGFFLKEFGPADPDSGLRFAFLSPDKENGGNGAIFVWGDEAVMRHSYVTSSVRLPGGAEWLLAAAPQGGWNEGDPYSLVLYALLMLVSAGLFVFLWQRNNPGAKADEPEGRLTKGQGGNSGGGWAAQAGLASRELGFFSTKAVASIDAFENEYTGLFGGATALHKCTARLRESLRPFSILAGELGDYSEAASGRLVPERREFDIGALVASIERELSSEAASRGLSLHCSVAKDVPTPLRGDAARLARALSIILRESISRSERGEVSLAVLPEPTKGKVPMLRFVIRDEGAPVAPERAAAVFDSFSAVRGPLSQRNGTSGVGMACAKALLDSMHAGISVEPGAGAGLSITCILPFEAPRNVAGHETVGHETVDHDAADDGAMNHDAVGVSVEPAISAMPAAAAVPEVESESPPEASFGSGIPATKPPAKAYSVDAEENGKVGSVGEEIPSFASFLSRNRPGARRHFKGPVVAGAVFMPEDEAELLVEFPSSPVGAGEVQFEAAVESSRMPGTPAAPESPAESASSAEFESPESPAVAAPEANRKDEIIEIDFRTPFMKPEAPGPSEPWKPREKPEAHKKPAILLVDDGEVNREIMVRMLASRGYACDTADGGASALERCADKDYDIVFMDCFMPGIDGYAAASRLREIRGPDRPRIVGMSAMLRGGEAERCKEAGMDDMIAKPFTVDELAKKIAFWGDIRGRSGSTEGE